MATHTSIADFLDDCADKLRDKLGSPALIVGDLIPAKIASIPFPTTYEVGVTTVRKTESTTENYATNDNLRIYGSDGKIYTLAEWNTLFVAAGYDAAQMSVAPDGFAFRKTDGSWEAIMWSNFQGTLYRIDGSAAESAKNMPHSPYNTLVCITAADSGTDSVTGKAWSITSYTDTAGDLGEAGKEYWALYTENTGKTFYVPKGLAYGNANADSADFAERTESLYQVTEWYRHRFAIDSGLTTTKADGTMADVSILGSGGATPAAGEEMYFYVDTAAGDTPATPTNTGKLAKYNLCNLHKGNATSSLTSALSDTLYGRQRDAGINMNDTGVNSASKPILAPGAKGAEAIAVGGKWMIITPYITQASQITSAPQNVVSDSPVVYYVHSLGRVLPSCEALERWFFNLTLVNALRSYLNTVEGRGIISETPGSSWTSLRYAATVAWYVNPSSGNRSVTNTYTRCRAIPASGL